MRPKPLVPVLNRSHRLARGLLIDAPFFERGGTVAHNLAERRFNGSFSGMTGSAWTVDRNGTAIVADGVNDEIDFGNSALLRTKRYAWLILLKADTSSDTGVNRGPLQNGSDGAGGAFHFYMIWSHTNPSVTRSVRHWTGSAEVVARYNSTLAAGTWYMLAASYDGTALSAFLDGVLHQRVNGAEPAGVGTTGLLVCAIPTAYLAGKYALFRLWNRALSDKEIRDQYTDPWELYRPARVVAKPPISRRGARLLVPGFGIGVY